MLKKKKKEYYIIYRYISTLNGLYAKKDIKGL